MGWLQNWLKQPDSAPVERETKRRLLQPDWFKKNRPPLRSGKRGWGFEINLGSKVQSFGSPARRPRPKMRPWPRIFPHAALRGTSTKMATVIRSSSEGGNTEAWSCRSWCYSSELQMPSMVPRVDKWGVQSGSRKNCSFHLGRLHVRAMSGVAELLRQEAPPGKDAVLKASGAGR